MEDLFDEGKCLSGQGKINNGAEQRNKFGAIFECSGSPFLEDPGEVTWDSHSHYDPAL